METLEGSLPAQTVVALHGMNAIEYNGFVGQVLQVPDQVPGRTPVFVFRKRRKILVKPENLSVASIQEAFEEVCKSLACDELAMTLKDLATHRSLSLNCTLVAERASTGRLDKATSSRTAKHPQSGVVYSSIIDDRCGSKPLGHVSRLGPPGYLSSLGCPSQSRHPKIASQPAIFDDRSHGP